jgi:diphthamide synthase (EF-2-diphthine--ammonia ligase)
MMMDSIAIMSGGLGSAWAIFSPAQERQQKPSLVEIEPSDAPITLFRVEGSDAAFLAGNANERGSIRRFVRFAKFLPLELF